MITVAFLVPQKERKFVDDLFDLMQRFHFMMSSFRKIGSLKPPKILIFQEIPSRPRMYIICEQTNFPVVGAPNENKNE